MDSPTTQHATKPHDAAAYLQRSGSRLIVRLAGVWTAGKLPLTPADVAQALAAASPVEQLAFDGAALGEWDSGLLAFVLAVKRLCRERGVPLDEGGLPQGARRVLALAAAAPDRVQTPAAAAPALLVKVGAAAQSGWRGWGDKVAFLGAVTLSCGRFFTGKAHFPGRDLVREIRHCGVAALPIVSLISFLVGVIFAFVGAVQLAMFGAQIYVASLVGIAIVRIMGAIMTGIILAGRTGSAFAAQIGTMQVNEEIDALVTFGIDPVDFLVLPRLFALTLMMPLLCLYADLMGILGGYTIGVLVFDLNSSEYLRLTANAVRMKDFWVGLFHSAVFGVLVAMAGTLRGMQCGRSASAVGEAATSAVVTGIVSIIVATAVITVLCNIVGI